MVPLQLSLNRKAACHGHGDLHGLYIMIGTKLGFSCLLSEATASISNHGRGLKTSLQQGDSFAQQVVTLCG